MSETLAFRIEQLDNITTNICEICNVDIGVRTQIAGGTSVYICRFCKKKDIIEEE